MIELTRKEQEALIVLYKGVNEFYNANSLARCIGITQVGAMKLLKRLEKEETIISKKIGKSIAYKLNIQEEFVQRIIGFALINEARKYTRWKEEFKSLYEKGIIVLFYGSASRDYAQARDIDIMIIQNKKDIEETTQKIKKIQIALPKKLHEIIATKEDLIKNIKKDNKAMIEIIKTAIVLSGYDDYMEIVNGFTNF